MKSALAKLEDEFKYYKPELEKLKEYVETLVQRDKDMSEMLFRIDGQRLELLKHKATEADNLKLIEENRFLTIQYEAMKSANQALLKKLEQKTT